MKIAYCTDFPDIQKNRAFNRSITKKYPGDIWSSIFAELAKQEGIEVTTGDIALTNVKSGRLSPTEILVIQSQDASDGTELVKLGALPFILIAMEVPLYSYPFYKRLPKIAPQFKNRILYPGLFNNFKAKSGKNFDLHFPSFDKNSSFSFKKWGERKFLVMVVANKYFEKNFPWPLPKYPSEHFDYLKEKLLQQRSPIRKAAVKKEVVSKRLEAIEYFGFQGSLDLFGSGWDNLSILPYKWRHRLKSILTKLQPTRIKDKIRTISNYKFSICFENTVYPGVITEKIIDCFVAGVIPIYLGAPDVVEFIPKGSFIDMRQFKSWQEIDGYLHQLNEKDALKMISKGQNFLKSPKGELFSYQSMAQRVMKLIEIELSKSH